MPLLPERKFKTGDFLNQANNFSTIVEIVKNVPLDPDKQKKIIDGLNKKWKTHTSIRFILGENLADNPVFAQRVDRNALYVIEN